MKVYYKPNRQALWFIGWALAATCSPCGVTSLGKWLRFKAFASVLDAPPSLPYCFGVDFN